MFGCTVSSYPPRNTLIDALKIKIQLTENQIEGVVDFDMIDSPKILRLKLIKNKLLNNNGSKLVMVDGSCSWKYPGEKIRENDFFEIFLEQGIKSQSWRLAIPVNFKDGFPREWISYALPIDK